MEQQVEVFAALYMAVMGLSHIIQPQAWVEFFIWLRGKGRAGVFVNGFLCLSFGAFIVAFHNVWSGLPMILTLLGWSQVLKGLLSFLAPQIGMRTLARVSPERSREFVAAGAVLLVVSALLWASVLTS